MTIAGFWRGALSCASSTRLYPAAIEKMKLTDDTQRRRWHTCAAVMHLLRPVATKSGKLSGTLCRKDQPLTHLAGKLSGTSWRKDQALTHLAGNVPGGAGFEVHEQQTGLSSGRSSLDRSSSLTHLAGEVPGGGIVQVHDGKALRPVLAALLLLRRPPRRQVVIRRRQPPVSSSQVVQLEFSFLDVPSTRARFAPGAASC